MLVLGIETSCDETSAAVVENGRHIVSNIVASQIKIHKPYSGVVPELASRAHVENVNRVVEAAIKKAGLRIDSLKDGISAVIYTRGPGLAGSLLVGQLTARTLSYLFKIPLIDVNHIEGHLYSALLEYPGLMPPYLGLVVSGGHTEIVIVEGFGRYKYLGGTRDDAAGEAFDKVAKLLSLGYPGGPVIDRLSGKGDAGAVKFTRPYLRGSWDFSFSGLKTAVLNYVKKFSQGHKLKVNDICASFQQTVVDTLIYKTFLAANKHKMRKIVVGGGVAANSLLRKEFLKRGRKEGIAVYLTPAELCTDNAAMIACAGYFKLKTLKRPPAPGSPKIEPGLKLENW